MPIIESTPQDERPASRTSQREEDLYYYEMKLRSETENYIPGCYIAKPYETIINAARGGCSAADFEWLARWSNIGDRFDAWNNAAFHTALGMDNHYIINYLLLYPRIFDYVSSNDNPNYDNAKCIVNFLEYYFPILKKKMLEFKQSKPKHAEVFNVGGDDAMLYYLILRNLIKTYDKRHTARWEFLQEEKSKYRRRHTSLFRKIYDYIEARLPNIRNVYLDRIKLLLRIPGVREIANRDNNELLRLAVGLGGRDEIVKLLYGIPGVAALAREQPIDAEYERKHPIDFAQKYKNSHPIQEVKEYEYATISKGSRPYVDVLSEGYKKWFDEKYEPSQIDKKIEILLIDRKLTLSNRHLLMAQIKQHRKESHEADHEAGHEEKHGSAECKSLLPMFNNSSMQSNNAYERQQAETTRRMPSTICNTI